MPDQVDPGDPRLTALIELIGRTGAEQFQLRYSDDEKPVVWMAVGKWGENFEAGGALTPLKAVLRLAETVIDGGLCLHCKKPTSVSDDFTEEMPLQEHICWYQYDPENKTFRRSCEADV